MKQVFIIRRPYRTNIYENYKDYRRMWRRFITTDKNQKKSYQDYYDRLNQESNDGILHEYQYTKLEAYWSNGNTGLTQIDEFPNDLGIFPSYPVELACELDQKELPQPNHHSDASLL